MQPLTKHREVESGGVAETKRFGISFENQEHIKMLLRDAIYSDKILAVLREYSANAWDAHRMVGKADLPIEVQIPTWENPVLLVKDFGPGLSHDEAFNVFTQYGASTKRGSNDAVGMLGIGSKAGFAYSDTFTVISRHGGKQRTYVAVLNEDEEDVFSLLSEEDHDPADTGLTIQIAVRSDDIGEFTRKAKDLFRHFRPRPKINLPLPPEPKIAAKLKEGLIYDKTHEYWEEKRWFAIMGCIPYRVELDQLKGPDGALLISESFLQTSGLLYFDIGGIQINASREALKYSKLTKEVLVKKFEEMLEEYVKTVLDEVENGGGTDWEKRVQLQRLLALGLGKKEIGDLAEDYVRIGDSVECLEFDSRSIRVAENTRIIRRTAQSNQDLRGYEFHDYRDVLVTPAKIYKKDDKGMPTPTGERYPEDVVWAALDKLIQDKKMGGITVIDLHELPWTAPPPPPGKKKRHYSPKEYNAKHRVSSFRYLGFKSRGKLSDNWEVADRVPQDDDVFVILDKFEPDASLDRSTDEAIASFFGLQLPEVYGYKTTEKKPVTHADVKGVHYDAWKEKFLKGLPADKVADLVQRYHWAIASRDWHFHRPEVTIAGLWDALGSEHLITKYLYNLLKAGSGFATTQRMYSLLGHFKLVGAEKPEPGVMMEQIKTAYPLLADAGLKMFWRGNEAEWRRYVRLVDNEVKAAAITYADIAVPPAIEG